MACFPMMAATVAGLAAWNFEFTVLLRTGEARQSEAARLWRLAADPGRTTILMVVLSGNDIPTWKTRYA